MSNHTRQHASAFSTAGSSARRRASLPEGPSGRFDALIDMGNPMKGVNLLPYLQRGLEGRALKAMGPAAALELSRTVFEDAVPRRWPREVCRAIKVPMESLFSSFTKIRERGCIHFLGQVHGVVQRIIGSQGNLINQFSRPYGLALSPCENFVLVADRGNRRVVVIRTSDGSWVRTLTGPPGTLQGSCACVAVVPASGEVLVSDFEQHRVVRFRSIEDDTVLGYLGGDATQLNGPTGMAILPAQVCVSVC
jgi:hypothetical protein